jgi:hypothetical protein
VSAETNGTAPSTAGGKVPAVRRRHQKGTFIKRDDVWFGQWREYVRLPDGTQRAQNLSKTFPGMSERAARAALDAILITVNAANGAEAQKAIPKAGRTLEDGVKEWRKLVAVNHKPRGRETAESHLRAHILPKLGSLAVEDLTAKRLQGKTGNRAPRLVSTSSPSIRSIVGTS